MPFSVLLLTAASPERHISGYGGDRVSMRGDLLSGELVLFFDKVDSDLVRNGLGMETKCCDGIIFRAHDQQIIICLVEMKTENLLRNAGEQVKDTYEYLMKKLNAECISCKDKLNEIIWRAYIYRSGGAPKKDVYACVESLEKAGFKSGNVVVLGNPDITDFLRYGLPSKRQKSPKHHRR
jgi:ribosomal protein L31E